MKTLIRKWQRFDVNGRSVFWPVYALAMIALIQVCLLSPVAFAQQSTTVFYVGTAVDSGGLESGFSNESPATVSASHNVVNLSWTASTTTTVVGYNIYRGKVSGGPYVKINSALISGTAFVDTITFPASQTNLKSVVP